MILLGSYYLTQWELSSGIQLSSDSNVDPKDKEIRNYQTAGVRNQEKHLPIPTYRSS